MLNDSIVRISSSDPDNESFGTGFVIKQEPNATYVLTCTHVINDIGGEEQARIRDLPAKLTAYDSVDGFDLAVLEVETNIGAVPLSLQATGRKGMPFSVTGFGVFEKKTRRFVIRPLRGVLGEQVVLESDRASGRVAAWDLIIEDDFSVLKKGYSGSPVIDESTGAVFAVASHSQIHGTKGHAISIVGLAQVWPEIFSDLLNDSQVSDRLSSSSEYRYDVFLSYRDDFSGLWVRDYFIPLFKWSLQDFLGYHPEIFVAKQATSTGNTLPTHLKNALKLSRILVPVWSPSYFGLLWSMYECSLMFYREGQLGYRTPDNPVGLLLPVVVCDGNSFPEPVRSLPLFDCRNYMIPVKVFGQSEKYLEFRENMQEWTKSVGDAIRLAPTWQQEWLDLEPTNLLKVSKPQCPLPTLG